MSRAIGDLSFKRNENLPAHKQAVISDPDVQYFDIDDDIDFVILASDGLWGNGKDQEIVDYIYERLNLKEGKVPSEEDL